MSEKDLIKASGSIHIPHKLNLDQQRLWNVCLAHAYHDLGIKEVHTISETDLLSYYPYETRHTDRIKEDFKVLMGTVVEYNILGKGGPIWGAFAMLAHADLKDGVCSYSYAITLRERLQNPAIYTKINLLIQQRFSSKHALSLYELCLDYLGVQETPWLEVSQFREYMGIEEYEYKAYRDMNTWVIRVAINEINKQSDLALSLKTQRKHRKISHLKFLITKKKDFQLKMPLFEKISAQKPSKTKDYTQHPLYKKLCAYPRFTAQEAIQILQTWSEMEVYKTCKYADDYLEPIKSYPAFLKKCLSEGWHRQNEFNFPKSWWDTLDQNKRSSLYMKDFKAKHPNMDSASSEFQQWLIELWQQHLIQTEFAFS